MVNHESCIRLRRFAEGRPAVLSMGGALDQRQDAAADFGAEQVAQVEADVIEF